MLAQSDTIVALSTPPGRSGIGVIRLSGAISLDILRQLVRDESFSPQPNILTLRNLFEPATDLLDQALVCYFKAPHSFTGEDVVELHCHGSPVLLRTLIDATLILGARVADPGEFSLRAVANGRLSLAEAEAIRDLIEAQTDDAVRQATRQMKGEISHALQPVKDELLKVIVRLESSLEFVEDDLPAVENDQIQISLRNLRAHLESLASTFSRGRLLREGVRVTFVGRPNVGKSSLFNSLLGRERAIVTQVPGTTRDTITESIAVDGIPILLTDTAGLRSSIDQIEAIGIDRTRREAADSDLLIVVIDGSESLHEEDRKIINDVGTQRFIVAVNKNDLANFSVPDIDGTAHDEQQERQVVAVSAKTNGGLEHLRTAILESFNNGGVSPGGLLITNARHYDLLRCTIEAVRSSESLLAKSASEELILVGLHNALRFLGEITGETTPDEILGKIFSTFCIGK